MRVLIDTNIIIYREDPEVLTENFQSLMNTLNDSENRIVVHPLSIEEIKKDPNEERRKVNLSKVKTYSLLKYPPFFDKDTEFNSIVEPPTNMHDYVDHALLYAIYKNAVSFLITQDKGIHKKAIKLKIDERILLIDEALSIFQTVTPPNLPPAIHMDSTHNLDYGDPILNHLKEDYYPEFEEWFKKIQAEGRECLIYRNNDESLGALLIFKDENEPIYLIDKILPEKERMKIATLIVSSNGYKIGEFFIQWATNYAIKKGFDEIYLTHFTVPEDVLVYLIEEYGFIRVGQKNYTNQKGDFEDVFVKYLKPNPELIEKIKNISSEQLSKIFYPKFYDCEEVKKFIIPILPEYHDRLFLGSERQSSLYEHQNKFIVEGNAIKKAYLSHSNIKKISKGDLLLFYRSTDYKSITCIGVVENVIPNLEDADEITKQVGKRTVYSPQEINEIADHESPTLVLLFIFSTWIPHKVSLVHLKEINVLNNAPQTIQEISHESYLKIKKAGGIDAGFTIN
jgi:rRNA-processing protein FCF1/predicted RNA-binding protein with PUA-like domain